eukprot:TRINITY_DN12259_c0_g1_i1.p1 TRINITY_DN12259_c0_g1~~TRINITY_DN12259_c0_g1_i1.p1  ORF type:complete len:229 (+),score=88.31 TRINITY_DN12259_c0_g1_i1:58-687(+)
MASSSLSLFLFALCLLFAVSFSTEVVKLTPENFNEVNEGTWFVEFYAPWCGHCKRLEPVWAELANTLEGEVTVASVDATEFKGLARRFNINGFPTLILFKEGYYYRFTGPDREEATLLKYVRELYPHSPDKARLPQDTWYEPYLALMEVYVDQLLDIVQTKKAGGATFFTFGFLSGIIFALALLFPSPRVIYRNPQAAPTPKKDGPKKD